MSRSCSRTFAITGSESEQVTARRHNELTTFGLLKDAPVAEVRGYIEQLIAQGYLRQTDDARLAMSKRMGADVALDYRAMDVVSEVRKLTGGGADVAVEALGYLGGRDWVYSLGCVGHGVSTTHLNGQTIRDLVLELTGARP